MAPQLFDYTVPLKVFSFRANTDYRRIPRVSEAPFQQSDSLPQSALFQSNNNTEHSPTAIIPKNSRVVPCLTFDFYALTFQNLQYNLAVQTHEVILTNTTYIDLCKCLRGGLGESQLSPHSRLDRKWSVLLLLFQSLCYHRVNSPSRVLVCQEMKPASLCQDS